MFIVLQRFSTISRCQLVQRVSQDPLVIDGLVRAEIVTISAEPASGKLAFLLG